MSGSSRASSRSSGCSSRTRSGPTSRPAGSADPGGAKRAVLDRALLAAPALETLPALLGARLVRDDPDGRRVGRIVELEAYIGEADRASHARFGPTDRNRVMWGPPGIAYVYLVYGMYDCLNVVVEPEGRPAAVLVRAVEPLEGLAAMRDARLAATAARRRVTPDALEAERIRVAALPPSHLARGPGLVAAAFGLDRTATGLDLLDPASPVRLERAPVDDRPADPVWTPRIGITYAGQPWVAHPWRLVDRASAAVSGPRPRGNAPIRA